jgi:hypothetical protein
MAKYILCLVAAVFFGGGLLGCDAEDDRTNNLLPCGTHSSASIRAGSGLKEGRYTMAIKLDGERQTCSFRIPYEVTGERADLLVDCGDAQASRVTAEVWTECLVRDASACDLLAGPWHINLYFTDAPQKLALELDRDGDRLLQEERQLTYSGSSDWGCNYSSAHEDFELTESAP